MRHLTLALLATLLVSCTSTPPHMLGTAMNPMLVHTLMQQAVKWSRYPMPAQDPIVDLVPESVWMKDQCPDVEKSDECGLLGYYQDSDPAEVNVVHVRAVMPPESMRDPGGVAVHELVHWLQSHNGWGHNGMCSGMAAREMEAYSVEYVNDLAMKRFRPFFMPDLLGRCIAASPDMIIEVIR